MWITLTVCNFNSMQQYDSMYDDFLRTIRKNRFILLTVVISFTVSAAVGSVFGYYGATFINIGSDLAYPIQRDEGSLPRGLDESTAVISIVKKYSPAVVSIIA